MQKNSKIEGYLGFCIKAGKATLGLDRAEELHRPPALLLADNTLSPGSKKRAFRLAEKFTCPLIVCEGISLAELIHRPACKFLAVGEKHLASAIVAAAENDENFTLLKTVGIGGNR